MKFYPNAKIRDIIYVEPTVHGDDRGYFFESYHSEKFKENGISCDLVQDNQSRSKKGILRGLHYQLAPKAQAKLVRVLEGTIFDVAVDIRKESKTYGQWAGYTLSAEKHDMLFIPAGFAHGFYVTSELATVMYKCSELYAPELEQSLIWNDPTLNIKWPIDTGPFLSDKDTKAEKF